jgi:hypothetical protein
MFCHISLQATTTEISSYMICQSYLKMYHWQSEHECGTCMMVLRHILAMLWEMFHDQWIGKGGPIAWPPCPPDSIPLDFYLQEHLKSLVHIAPVDNAGALHHRIVDVHQTICNYTSILERMWRSTMRHVKACTESHGGHFEHLL